MHSLKLKIMKTLFTSVLVLLLSINGSSQTMQASIGTGSAANRVILYMRPSVALNNAQISTLQFTVAINASITPAPTVSIVGTPAFSIPWTIDPSYVEAGYRIYDFTTAASPQITINPAVETQVMEIEFSGGPATANDVVLLTLPEGGTTTGNTLFFCSGAASSIEGQLYYTRPGTTVINNNSYTGTLSSTATIGGILLPVTWLSFNAVKQDNNALLNWAVGNEDACKHYELQRSTDGASFTTIGTVTKGLTGNYDYVDAGINSVGVPVLYYRIKQVDVNGRITYSDIRQLRLNVKGTDISIYPNPVTTGFYVSVPLSNPGNNKVKLQLIAPDGKLAQIREVAAAQAGNYYFSIKENKLAAGQYSLQVIYQNNILDTKKLYINQ
jgi:hypothetical protein